MPSTTSNLDLTEDDLDPTGTANCTPAVYSTVETLYSNGVRNTDLLVSFGRRMSALCNDGCLTISEAKVKAADELLRGGQTIKDTAALLDMTKGGYSKLKADADDTIEQAHNCTVMTTTSPTNLRAKDTLRTPDGSTQMACYLLEHADPDPDDPECALVTITDPDVEHATVDPVWYWYDSTDELVTDWYHTVEFARHQIKDGWHIFLTDAGLSI